MKKLPDNFLFGILFGIISLFVTYSVVRLFHLYIVEQYGYGSLMRPPRIPLFTIVINVLIFRFIMLNFQKENTGKGFLFITAILSFVYFFIFFRTNMELP